MQFEQQIPLKTHNTLGVPATARQLARVRCEADLNAYWAWHCAQESQSAPGPDAPLVLGAGSNIVLTRDVPRTVIKMEIPGREIVEQSPEHVILDIGAGESWHDTVMWTLSQGWGGLENLALIPGTAGAAPVQNIGAYGLEIKDRLVSVRGMHLHNGQWMDLSLEQCQMAYRDSIFKGAWAGQFIITRIRLCLPKVWVPVLDYHELQKWVAEIDARVLTPMQVAGRVIEIRRQKLPDPQVLGNVGSFFKNPIVSPEQCMDIIGRDPELVHYPLADGRYKLAAAWLIDACGWKGKTWGHAGVHDRQALVLVNRGGATGSEVMALAAAIQESVYGRFGIRLEPEPVVL